MKLDSHLKVIKDAHYRYMLLLTLFRIELVDKHTMGEVYNSMNNYFATGVMSDLFPDPY